MTTVTGATASAATAATTTNAAAKTGFAQNFDTFLTLLTAQLKNQDPMSPLDTNQFTQQLVSFSQVEQQINTNDNLQSLITLQNANQVISALPLVGHAVEYTGNSAPLADGQATFSYTLPSQASAASLTVTDANGKVVYTTAAQTGAGRHDFVWDGKNNAGSTLADGNYTLQVQAVGTGNVAITPTFTATGTVSGVESDSNVATFDINGLKVPVSSLLNIRNSQAS